MKEPIDPIRVRQARQGKPVLVILTVSLFLAIICGAALWLIFADRGETGSVESGPPSVQTTPEYPPTANHLRKLNVDTPEKNEIRAIAVIASLAPDGLGYFAQ